MTTRSDWILSGSLNPTWESPLLRKPISVEKPSVWQWKHWCLKQRCYIKTLVNTGTDFLTVPFVYWADRPRLNRKGLVCVWSINQKFVKHKVAPNEAFTHRLVAECFPAPFVTNPSGPGSTGLSMKSNLCLSLGAFCRVQVAPIITDSDIYSSHYVLHTFIRCCLWDLGMGRAIKLSILDYGLIRYSVGDWQLHFTKH